MTISELIAALLSAQAERGDVPVVVRYNDYDGYPVYRCADNAYLNPLWIDGIWCADVFSTTKRGPPQLTLVIQV